MLDNAHCFGTSTRNPSQAKQTQLRQHQTPGPGSYLDPAYNAYAQRGTAEVTIKSRQHYGSFAQVRSKAPGPGQYNPDLRASVSSQQGFKIGKSERTSFKDVTKTPGPGAFGGLNWNMDSAKAGSSFGPHGQSGVVKDDRSKALLGANVNNPGPGNYNIDKNSRSAPAYSMSMKPKNKDDNWQPGPGMYNPNMNAARVSAEGTRIGTSTRPDLTGAAASKISEPGPGQYTVHARGFENLAYSVGNSKRREHKKTSDSAPGPGAYNLKSTVS
jgi:hypothetical protein